MTHLNNNVVPIYGVLDLREQRYLSPLALRCVDPATMTLPTCEPPEENEKTAFVIVYLTFHPPSECGVEYEYKHGRHHATLKCSSSTTSPIARWIYHYINVDTENKEHHWTLEFHGWSNTQSINSQQDPDWRSFKPTRGLACTYL